MATKTATRRQWIKHDGKLCLDGYPVHIRQNPPAHNFPYTLVWNGRESPAYCTLAMAMRDGERRADELDMFIVGGGSGG